MPQNRFRREAEPTGLEDRLQVIIARRREPPPPEVVRAARDCFSRSLRSGVPRCGHGPPARRRAD